MHVSAPLTRTNVVCVLALFVFRHCCCAAAACYNLPLTKTKCDVLSFFGAFCCYRQFFCSVFLFALSVRPTFMGDENRKKKGFPFIV